MQHWLLKTEPETYGFSELLKEKKTNWNEVRNFQARNFLRNAKKGDLALIYHSGKEKAVVGIARVLSEPYPDPDPEARGDWVQIDVAPLKALNRPVALTQIKTTTALQSLPLLKQSRLSVMPITETHFREILKLSGTAL